MDVGRVLKGDLRSISRLITLVENNEALDVMKEIHKNAGNAHIVGITGTMGTGKSTIIGKLAKEYRKNGKEVGIIGIDPTSWFSGGAFLGDRVRMQELATDKGIFIRSMGTRGTLGGLTSSIYDVVEILDASGKDVVMVETVGVGQSEIDIAKMADTTVVVTVPGLGDFIQNIKAGITEIADIFVVNKADRLGVEETMMELRSMIEMNNKRKREIPVNETIATTGKGIEELYKEIGRHMKYLIESELLEERRKKRYETELVEIIKKRLLSFIFDESKLKGKIESLIDKISKKEIDPYSAADEILGKVLK